ncbi:hypothetical protein [Chryseobacterium sp. 3008163]|uniref:hypothetical protein n=1 Tax=Chryseobacterium sp. 3008163 TaxID=2478663 RepID=UPI000F0BE05E|nr:hypothetical protein [Chryseobacterium sp. 3008163]AYN00859.1 hypothetical protein EAG08_11535 [Chryseobacterium sp. 3008163]
MTKKTNIKDLLYWFAIFTVSGSMLVYGVSKPFQFESVEKIGNITKLSGQEIMWVFYGYSKSYPIIVGIFEIIGAISLLFNKTRILGCLILTIILINVIIQDYIYNVVALSSAIYYQILIILILLFDNKRLKNIITALFYTYDKSKTNILIISIALIIAIILKFYETKLI